MAAEKPRLDADLAPHLSERRFEAIGDILNRRVSGQNAEKAEAAYRTLVRNQLLKDLKAIYLPENEDKVQVAYAAFTPHDSHRSGADLGYGLHVVKRLELPVSGGKTKILFVNEHWGENKNDHGLYLPDEIRIQSQVAIGPRNVEGSHSLYLFELYRVGWSEKQRPVIAQRSAYRWNEKTQLNERVMMRVPASAPYSCRGCHSATHTVFVQPFLREGQKRNFETIVQDGYFKLPVSEMAGFKEYIDYLKRKKVDAGFIERAKVSLLDTKRKLALPTMAAAIETLRKEHSEMLLGEDTALGPVLRAPGFDLRQGVYFHAAKKSWYVDNVESLVEGKYVWWEPESVIP